MWSTICSTIQKFFLETGKKHEIYYELLRSGQEFEAENFACPKKSLVKYNG